MLIKLSEAKKVLELGVCVCVCVCVDSQSPRVDYAHFFPSPGTFTGYSALTFAEALPSDGQVYTVDNNVQSLSIATKFFSMHPDGKKIKVLNTTAENALKDQIEREKGGDGFDFVFVDADKKNYAMYYDLIMGSGILNRSNKKAMVAFDNTLWKGKIRSEDLKDKHAAAIQLFNEKIAKDTTIEQVILPVRDGITLITRR